MESDQEEKLGQDGKQTGQMSVQDMDQLQCLACPEQVPLFPSFTTLENYLLSIHKVSDLLRWPHHPRELHLQSLLRGWEAEGAGGEGASWDQPLGLLH